MIRAESLALDLNLQSFSKYLADQSIRHRINEESGQQVIWVEDEAEAEFVRATLAQWQFDPAADTKPRAGLSLPSASKFTRAVVRVFLGSPISVGLVAICLLVAVVSELGMRADRVEFLFYPLLSSSSLMALLAGLTSPAVILQSLTPMFLHFGELHLVFNMLWLLYFGKQLESIHRGWVFAVLIVLLAFASNTAQYLYSHYNNFGGMSGVVYGLVGYSWVIHTFMPTSRLQLNNSMFVVFVIALVLMEVMASSIIASAAHLGGLVAGLLLGLLMVVYYRFLLGRRSISK